MKKENTYKKMLVKLTNSNKKRGWILYLTGICVCVLAMSYAYSMGFKSGICALMAAFGAIAILVGEHVKS